MNYPQMVQEIRRFADLKLWPDFCDKGLSKLEDALESVGELTHEQEVKCQNIYDGCKVKTRLAEYDKKRGAGKLQKMKIDEELTAIEPDGVMAVYLDKMVKLLTQIEKNTR